MRKDDLRLIRKALGYAESATPAPLPQPKEAGTLAAKLEARASMRNTGTTVSLTDGETLGYYSGLDSWLDREAATLIRSQASTIAALTEAAREVVKAYDDCTGAEPSQSVLDRAIDVNLRSALPATNAEPTLASGGKDENPIEGER